MSTYFKDLDTQLTMINKQNRLNDIKNTNTFTHTHTHTSSHAHTYNISHNLMHALYHNKYMVMRDYLACGTQDIQATNFKYDVPNKANIA